MIGVFVIFVATNGAVGAGETLPVGRCGQEVVFSSGLGDCGGAVALVTSLTTADEHEWAWLTHLYKWNADCVSLLCCHRLSWSPASMKPSESPWRRWPLD